MSQKTILFSGKENHDFSLKTCFFMRIFSKYGFYSAGCASQGRGGLIDSERGGVRARTGPFPRAPTGGGGVGRRDVGVEAEVADVGAVAVKVRPAVRAVPARASPCA